jgi:glutathione S-transferase
VRLVSFAAMNAKAHRALHPFGQIPTYEEGDLVLFESGAIVLHIAGNHAGLLPARRRECPGTHDRADVCRTQHGGAADPGPAEHQAAGEELRELDARLGDAPWLDGAFSART